jgi:signal transduction histidine kinase
MRRLLRGLLKFPRGLWRLFRRIWSTLYFKISLIFIVLMCFLGLLLGIIAVGGTVDGRGMIDQTITQEVAKNVVRDLEMSGVTTPDSPAIVDKFEQFQSFNPKSQLFLLDENGKILVSSPSVYDLQLDAVDIGPIKQFLDTDWSEPLRIVGDDPRGSDKRRIFSVAPISIGERAGYVYIVFSRPEFQIQFNQKIIQLLFGAWIISLVFGLFGILIVGLVLFFFVTRRFRRLKKIVQEFEGGDYTVRFKGAAHDEISQLGVAFNQMADAIEASVEVLEESSRKRRALVANVSHDLRTPLTTIQGYLEMILIEHKNGLSQDVQKFLGIMDEEVESLATLVRELFDLSRYDGGDFAPQYEAFSAGTLAEDIVQKLLPLAADKYVSLRAETTENTPYVFADFSMIERAVSNLAVNALHATPPKGEVVISVTPHDGLVEISVSDTGTGIPEEDIPHLFDRFYRVQKARSRNPGGSGLGLAIVKSILDLHNTEVGLTSKVEEGTTFRFTLQPFSPAEQHQATSTQML